MENEKKEEEKKPEEAKPEEKAMPTLVELTERLEKANEEAKLLLERNEELAARNLLGGHTDAGQQPVEKKELTPTEYKDAVMRGEVHHCLRRNKMHAIFMLYGIKHAVEHMLMDMQAQKFQLRIYKEGAKDQHIWMQGSLRLLPFGFYDYQFPKEDRDLVLTTLNFQNPPPYNLGKSILGLKPLELFKKFLEIKDIPEFKTDKKLIWITNNVAMIPIGIKEDGELEEPEGEYKGWKHEAI